MKLIVNLKWAEKIWVGSRGQDRVKDLKVTYVTLMLDVCKVIDISLVYIPRVKKDMFSID